MQIMRIIEITADSWARESEMSGVLCAASAVSQPRQAAGQCDAGGHREATGGTQKTGNFGRSAAKDVSKQICES